MYIIRLAFIGREGYPNHRTVPVQEKERGNRRRGRPRYQGSRGRKYSLHGRFHVWSRYIGLLFPVHCILGGQGRPEKAQCFDSPCQIDSEQHFRTCSSATATARIKKTEADLMMGLSPIFLSNHLKMSECFEDCLSFFLGTLRNPCALSLRLIVALTLFESAFVLYLRYVQTRYLDTPGLKNVLLYLVVRRSSQMPHALWLRLVIDVHIFR